MLQEPKQEPKRERREPLRDPVQEPKQEPVHRDYREPMHQDYSNLDASIAALTKEVAETKGTEHSTAALIDGFAEAIRQTVTIAFGVEKLDVATVTATRTIANTAAKFKASAAAIGSAVAANP